MNLKGIAMDASFQISDAQSPTTGDYLSFTITDGAVTLPGKISATALAILSPDLDREASFEANRERIRKAAFDMRRVNPGLDMINLGANNFSS
ncbi:hypothetical protein [Burkholderia multivorans]|uniref:hypothetical protein n=1 Tax=Burkholderia multivorans TaxID=87883 RepID=UPI001C21A42C|nr:hypothetical protein [Burkholderia multivorans]MBU9618126.1 hypothetical protein [Burkholderia multivorans]MCA8260861.1 hypothetical protein [Burkholderia multivorans]MDN7985681.1 hypothetical protein [Burkholderia multivorans]MDR9177951.1 hypothetical protein [Burkholderia multivorans]MDR9183963.1 hypothetical protein [Burkholderia multivorans]